MLTGNRLGAAEREVRVAEIEDLSPRLRRLRLLPCDRAPMAASPGSHLLVRVPGTGRAAAYSLIGDPETMAGYEIVVRRSERPDGVSHRLHGLAVGARLSVSPPRNFFAPAAGARRHLLLSAGIGLTPFLAYARAFPPQVDWHLVQIVRPEERAAFARLTAPFDPARITLLDGRAALCWPDWLDQPLDTHLSACGPAAFLETVCGEAAKAGWVPARVHVERFTAAEGQAFEVRLARSGGRLSVCAGQSLLEALESAGVSVAYLCRGGVCGACRVGVLAGRPEHRDRVLDAEERAGGKVMLACVSRARDDALTLDL
ncbi:flavin reductase family protein [Ancylobacter lacus]|uniref:flavin reductase family protein n=1 Tax=Ancylobacter lacus TaxID=2579970 RepID=UPI001BD045E2|nr:iron-sulfur cluster-binding domain-containing protein [Ancylobacter lacus]MBS7540333.1 iron-sulfur cluster-binding domain-containing protein [Ancylobacter lacus]